MTTSINFHLRPSTSGGRSPGKLFIRIIKSRESRTISRGYSVYPHEWDSERKRIIMPSKTVVKGMGDVCPDGIGVALRPAAHSGNDAAGSVSVGGGGIVAGDACSCVGSDGASNSIAGSDRVGRLRFIEESMRNDLNRLREIVASLRDSGCDYSAADVAERFIDSQNRHSVFGYACIVAERLCAQGRDRTARAYRSAARSLMGFSGGREVLLSEMDAGLMTGYEHYLLGKGLKLNTVSFYLRNLRALYFRAVGESLIPRQPANPFAGTHTGVYETRRRALDDRQLKALARLEDVLSENPGGKETVKEAVRFGKFSELRDSLSYFMFCYHARGMSFVDMAHLRKDDLSGDSLTYRRRKTGGRLEVKITEPMRRILSYFGGRTEHSDYLFPVIDAVGGDIRAQYENGLKRQNRCLKVLAAMAGIGENLSTHVARHTWATLAKRLNVPVAVIGEALGHRDVKTTSIYLGSFDRETMDELSVKLSDAVRAA